MHLFFFNDTATTEIYTLSLHDALPICAGKPLIFVVNAATPKAKITYEAAVALSQHGTVAPVTVHHRHRRSEEHTSELQSRQYLVCRLLLEKKKNSYTCSEITIISNFSL